MQQDRQHDSATAAHRRLTPLHLGFGCCCIENGLKLHGKTHAAVDFKLTHEEGLLRPQLAIYQRHEGGIIHGQGDVCLVDGLTLG